MATIQQLEKLHNIQRYIVNCSSLVISLSNYFLSTHKQSNRLFYVENSLEAAVAGERVTEMIVKTEQVIT